ncbi:hypothetical protein OS493_000237 [Desmophyllum pertusum]|uniref:4-hydroxy-4-methyl-2-oxoglutarate aldolase n=1 Tax=Desmophyllum pertusum TaxID=174260 RepID=A0A9X0A6R3_9CNID|nr:hypothetical protein OS493_000237 [Desmophyllum pertusum]
MGSLLTGLAFKRGWAGVVINGCIRDSEEIAEIQIGVKALATMPRKSKKTGMVARRKLRCLLLGSHSLPVIICMLTRMALLCHQPCYHSLDHHLRMYLNCLKMPRKN